MAFSNQFLVWAFVICGVAGLSFIVIFQLISVRDENKMRAQIREEMEPLQKKLAAGMLAAMLPPPSPPPPPPAPQPEMMPFGDKQIEVWRDMRGRVAVGRVLVDYDDWLIFQGNPGYGKYPIFAVEKSCFSTPPPHDKQIRITSRKHENRVMHDWDICEWKSTK